MAYLQHSVVRSNSRDHDLIPFDLSIYELNGIEIPKKKKQTAGDRHLVAGIVR